MAVIPDEYEFVTEEVQVPDIQGELYGGSSCLLIGMDVCVYSECAASRPWLGRVACIHEETSEFDIHWYQVHTDTIQQFSRALG